MAERNKRTLVIVPHTHWDREWYQPFEAFRARLVAVIDNLLDLLDRDPEYKYFVLDGQSIALEDYLEVRPDRRADIEGQVRAGRLLIGPNYVLPDEFLIGGESWVRNLQIGIRVAQQFGPVMMVGYSPDAFGHIAHLPAILRGFGIDACVLWRGVGGEATTSEFRWRAPDGSQVLALYLPFGYGIGARLPNDAQGLRDRLQSLRQRLEPLATTRYLLIPSGKDHAQPQEDLSQVIATANQVLDDAEVVHGHYPMLVEAIRRELDGRPQALPQLEGEFRSSQRSHVLAGVLSARIWIKQRYQECEDLLARWAEPFSAWAYLLQLRYRDQAERGRSHLSLLRRAWKLLLENAAHDSICGCSIDQVHEEMGTRFHRCHQLGEAVLDEALGYIAALAAPPDGSHVVVFNSENGPRDDFCTVRLTTENRKLPVALVDDDGERWPLQTLRRGLRSSLGQGEDVEMGFLARRAPPFGYRALRVEYGGGEPQAAVGSDDSIENEFFVVTADPRDGTLTVRDKQSGLTLSGLNRFLDGGDSGDEYNYCPPQEDQLLAGPAAPPQIRVTERGPARHTLEVALRYALPARLTRGRRRRTARRVQCPILSRISLYPGVRRIDIETTIDNRAEDHRLRVHFPSGLRSQHSHAEQHFGVVRRAIALPQDDGTWMETPSGTYPQKAFVDVSDGQRPDGRGLMLANRGLPEYEVLDGPDGVTIALTLLRCVGWLSRPDLSCRRGSAGPSLETPGAQMLGRWSFHYSLMPHAGSWENAYAEAHRFARPLRAIQSRGLGLLPPSGSPATIEPPTLVLSSFKLAEAGDGVVLRVYNIADGAVQGRLRLEEAHAAVELVNLNEEPIGQPTVEEGWIKLSAGPNQIMSIRFEPQLGGGHVPGPQ